MPRSPLAFLTSAALLALAFAATALGGRVDLPLRPGESAEGVVEVPGGLSTCAFLVTEGDKRKLSITVKRAKGSDLEPEVVLRTPTGEALDVIAAGGKLKAKTKATKIKLNDVPESGLWRVEVGGAGDTSGAYSIQVKVKEKLSQKANVVVPLGGDTEVPVTVGDAQSLSVSIKGAKKSELKPGIEIVAPDGTLLQSAVGAAVVNTKKGSAKLKKHELPSYGTYVVRFQALEATGGSGVYKIKTSPTKLKGKRPVARAGASFAAEPTVLAMLDGSTSEAAGNGNLTFLWTQVAGPPVELSAPTSARPTFVAPEEPGTLAFQLAVREGAVQSAPALVVVEVADRPIADPGRTRVVAPGSSTTLDGSASVSRDAGGLSATWRVIEGPGALRGADTMTPTFDAPSTPGVTRLGLTVDDGTAESFEARLLVVTSADPVTAADAGREQYVGRMATVFLSGLGSLRAGAPLDSGASWEQLSGPAVQLDGADTFFPSFQAPRDAADLLFELTVDGEEDATHRTWVRVRPSVENRAPRSDAGGHIAVPGTSVVLNAAASTDADGGDPADRWAVFRGTGATIDDPDAESTTADGLSGTDRAWVFAEMARDDLQYGAPDLKRVTRAGYAGPPLVDAGADRSVTATTSVTLDGTVTQSAGGGGLQYAWRQVSGLEWFDVAAESPTFNPFVPKPTFRLRTGISSLTTTRTITLEFTAGDANGTSEPDYVTITFTNLPRNGFPVAQASASVAEPLPGSTVTLSATATDPDGDPVTFRWSQVSGPNVTLQGGPNIPNPSFQAPTAGVLRFRVTPNDGIDDGLPVDVVVDVNERPTAVATADPPNGGGGVSVTFDGSGSSDPEGADLTYTWTQIAGTGVSFPANAESFTVTAPQGGFAFRLVVNDGAQSSSPVTVTYSDNAPPSVAPTATVNGSLAVTAAYGVTVTLQANPNDDDPATFVWRQIGVGANSPAVTLSSTSAENPTFTVPVPTTSSGAFGPNPTATFGIKAVRDGIESSEQTIQISFYASFNDTTLPASAPTAYGIISANCTSCHSGSNNTCPVGSGNNARGFGMGTASAFYSNAVGQASCGSTVKPRIATATNFAASQSYLVDRLNGQGGFMPPGGGGLPLQDRFIIIDWIDQGANQNR